ncbi:UbiD family decarboxylase, partial [Campylobacter coli]
MKDFIKILKDNDLLKVYEEPVDVDLEIAHLAYIEAKKGENGKALLFKNPIDKQNNKQYKFPVLMNAFCNEKALNLAFGRDYKEVADEISKLTKLHIPT